MHNESATDKQVNQVNATENFVLFINLTSDRLFNLERPAQNKTLPSHCIEYAKAIFTVEQSICWQ